MFLLLVRDRAINDFFQRFSHDNPFARIKRDERVAAAIDVSNQLCVENERFPVQAC